MADTGISIMSNNGGNSGNKRSVLMGAGDTREGTGILCNDPMGLCIAAEGAMSDEAKNAGVFTSMVRLASQLQGAAGSSTTAAPPLITIETDEATILVKAYDGHTVALRVPAAAASIPTTSAAGARTSDGASPDRNSATPASDAEAPDSGSGEVEQSSTC
jgi:hypothetical protein